MGASDEGARRSLVIGIDARAATEVGAGRGRVVREVLRALAGRKDPHRYVCYARTRWSERLDDRFRWKEISARDPVWHVRAAAVASRECDVFLSSNSYLTVPLLRVPAVTIVYDLITFERGMGANRRSLMIERVTLGTAVRRSRALVCISQATADALLARFPRAAGKIVVARLGVSPVLAGRADAELPDLPGAGFVLAVGTLEPRKNLPRLVDAYASLPRELQDAHPLVVVGARGWQTGETLAALRSLGERCRVLGHVPDEALAELYRRCAVFCYPSLGEGFGLPVLEAMAAGAAVLTSNVSSLPEVAGEAAEYADPRSVPSIAAALEAVLRAPRRRAELGDRGRARAAEFSWRATAATVLETLEQAANGDNS
jgi:glycosyltransferase involved in cell wall biosynthesis